MPTLRLTQTQTSPDQDTYQVQVEFERGGRRRTANARFAFSLTPQEHEHLRWYLEDYLEYPHDPAPTIAARIEKNMQEVGARLFEAVFETNKDTLKLWNRAMDDLDAVRLEIATDVAGATSLPWEFLFDPDTESYLALQAHTFVRTHTSSTREPDDVPAGGGGPIRILLVICRPSGRADVPFRSVAVRIIKGLSESARQAFQLEVLRPPTFERLAKALRDARSREQPYHIVHFDGHGSFLDVEKLYQEWRGKTFEEMMARLEELIALDPRRFSPELVYPRPRRPDERGYLVFENPESQYNLRLVDGPELGALLKENDVPVLVLNACRSAHAEAPKAPESVDADPHTQVRAFGSLAQEIMDEGVAGVVAMRYNVYVVTAAQFVADLYAALAQGHPLGQAVTLGRKQLHAQPLRAIAYEPMPLQDWPVPVVYEAAPIALFPAPAQETGLHIHLEAGDAAPRRGALDPGLPPQPDAGFYGRDETLLALDRAFDAQRVVLLHAYAGSGKTATAAEFARWYALTGGVAGPALSGVAGPALSGVEGPVLFTSFEQYKPLARALDQIEQVFGGALQQAGINWLALDDAARRQVALQVLAQVPVLWIWDNIEPVAGFPAGTESPWSADEQRELVDFLRAARGTRARFLLTSRRDERAWLGDLPARITLPPMPMQERVQLARALAEKHGRRLTDVQDWRPLLRFTRGNPLTITVTVGQALRDGLATKEQIEAFVAQLRAGEAQIEDEESEGRAKSLAASLSYGFETFSPAERAQLALLHFFQGFVDVEALLLMGHPEADWRLPQLRGLTRQAGIALLDRAAEIGLLSAHGDGYYTIHPALPWYFKALFDQHYAQYPISNTQSPTRAYVEAMGELGNYYHNQYIDGNRDVIAALSAQEANLLHARRLARQHGWWGRVVSVMQGLCQLYDHTGRRAEWAQLVGEIVPDFVDPASDGPLPGREEEWDFVTHYRVLLARGARAWAEAQRLQRVQVDWNRRRAAPALAASPETLGGVQRNAVRSLAVSLEQLGNIQRELGQAGCVTAYEEAITLSEQIDDRAEAAICAFNLGRAYIDLPALRDLAQAERWYRRSLDLFAERDRLGRGNCMNQLGYVAWERFKDARAAKRPEGELLRHLNAALDFYHQALDLLPPDAVDDLSVAYSQLGILYAEAGDFDRALPHWREGIRYFEAAGARYNAAKARFNVALALAQAGRLADARDYAHAALRDYQTYGDRASEDIQETQGLIALIEGAMG